MPQLTPTFFRQAADETLADLPRFPGADPKVRFTHILHPYFDRAVALNNAAQSITFKTLRAAADLAAPEVSTRHVCVTLPGEAHLAPDGWIRAAPLDRTILDVKPFSTARALPLLFDILDRGMAAETPPSSDGCRDYLVFSNSDIHVQPYFYSALARLIGMGHEAISINRRTLPYFPADVAELPLMLAEHGQPHPGHDCFVFPRDLYGRFVKTEACVGAGGVMRSLTLNLASFARRYLMLTEAHLTFHIGADRYWRDPRFEEYVLFNRREARKLAASLAADPQCREKLLGFLRANQERAALLKAAETGDAGSDS